MFLLPVLPFIILGYLCGSILFAQVWAKIFRKGDIIEKAKDHNPGASNAFTYGGFWCGLLTLICDVLKGIIPIRLFFMFGTYSDATPCTDIAFALVLAAPVIGHAFSIFNNFNGGKGIATTFGCLLGLIPTYQPVFFMAISFIFFSVILKISPHLYRTAISYLTTLIAMSIFGLKTGLVSLPIGFVLITVAVMFRLHRSPEEREEIEVNLAWKH
ncbi:MAG: glycerol-3-phosphate acyltransferase [Oscillospiraceae bacterium]|nr:glycerol-3-phosphate acyltransferase [Oscillospiraceae bacterium]